MTPSAPRCQGIRTEGILGKVLFIGGESRLFAMLGRRSMFRNKFLNYRINRELPFSISPFLPSSETKTGLWRSNLPRVVLLLVSNPSPAPERAGAPTACQEKPNPVDKRNSARGKRSTYLLAPNPGCQTYSRWENFFSQKPDAFTADSQPSRRQRIPACAGQGGRTLRTPSNNCQNRLQNRITETITNSQRGECANFTLLPRQKATKN